MKWERMKVRIDNFLLLIRDLTKDLDSEPEHHDHEERRPDYHDSEEDEDDEDAKRKKKREASKVAASKPISIAKRSSTPATSSPFEWSDLFGLDRKKKSVQGELEICIITARND